VAGLPSWLDTDNQDDLIIEAWLKFSALNHPQSWTGYSLNARVQRLKRPPGFDVSLTVEERTSVAKGRVFGFAKPCQGNRR